MSKEITTSAVSMQVMSNLLLRHGISAREIIDKTGIDISTLSNPDTRVPMNSYLQLWQLSIHVTKDPALGIHLKDYYTANQMHVVTSIIRKSANAFEALENFAKYCRLICDSDKLDIRHYQDGVLVVYSNTSSTYQNRWNPELYLSLLADHIQDVVEGDCSIEEVWMQHPAPGYAKEYSRVFKSPVLFSQPENHIRLKTECLEFPIRTQDPYQQAILKKYADDSLESISTSNSFKESIQSTIVQLLPQGKADAQSVADRHHMDRRTLHRRLKKEDTTFTALLEITRKELAIQYLQQELNLIQIADLLGFSAPSNFQAAFKRWFGVSPGEYRKN